MLAQVTQKLSTGVGSLLRLILVLMSWRFLFYITSLVVLAQLKPSENPATDTSTFQTWERAVDTFFSASRGFYIPSTLVLLVSGCILALRLRKSDDWAETLSEHYVVNFAFGVLVIVTAIVFRTFLKGYYNNVQQQVPLPLYSGAFDWLLIGLYLVAFSLLFVVQYYGIAIFLRKLLR